MDNSSSDFFSDDSSLDSFPCNTSSIEPPEGLLQRLDSFSDTSMEASSPELLNEDNDDEAISEVEVVENSLAISVRVGGHYVRPRRRNLRDDEIIQHTISDDSINDPEYVDYSSDSSMAYSDHNARSVDEHDLISNDDAPHNRSDVEFTPDDQFNVLSDAEIGVDADDADIISDDDTAPDDRHIISDEEIGLVEETTNDLSEEENGLPDNIEPVAGTSAVASCRNISKSPVIRTSKIKKRNKTLDDTTDDGQCCSICFEPWSNSGEHRIASLKCGHLFGKNCIERWLKGSAARCPQCNTNSSKRDIRVLYAKSIRALDTSEKDRMADELNKVKTEKVSLERKHAKVMMNNEINTQLVGKLQDELRMLKESLKNNAIQTIDISGSTQKMYRLGLCKSFDLSSGCRVMCYNEWLNMLAVSLTTTGGIFPGCGVKKINLFDMRIDKYIPIHRKQIRDLSFSPLKHEILLSVGMDQCIKITNVCSCATLHQYNIQSTAFSCCWKSLSSTDFYVGTSQGKVLRFNTAHEEPVECMTVSGSGPVVSLWHIPNLEGFAIEGLLVVRLDSICLLELSNAKRKEHRLSIEGPFTGLHYDPESKHCLINCRPSQRHPHARHVLCSLVAMEIDGSPFVELHEVYTFLGSSTMKLLSRSSIVVNMRGKTWVVVNEESTQCAKMYDASSSALVQRINFSSNVVECLPARIHNDSYIVFLTEKKVHLYKLLEH